MKRPLLAAVLLLAGGGAARAAVAECAGECDETHKLYSEALCGQDTVDDACREHYGKGFGAFLDRWAKICPPGVSGGGWLGYDEKCTLVDRKTDPTKSPAPLTREEWKEIGDARGYKLLLDTAEKDLSAYRTGHSAALKLYELLSQELMSRDDFEDELKRRTRGLMPDYGTKLDPRLRVINALYIYLGEAARDRLVGPDGRNGKLSFLDRVDKAGLVNLSEADAAKYLSPAARAGEKGGRALRARMHDLARGVVDPAKDAADAAALGVDAGFWIDTRAPRASSVVAGVTPLKPSAPAAQPPVVKAAPPPPAPAARRVPRPGASIDRVPVKDREIVAWRSGDGKETISEEKDANGHLLKVAWDSNGGGSLRVMGPGQLRSENGVYVIPKGVTVDRYNYGDGSPYRTTILANEDIAVAQTDLPDSMKFYDAAHAKFRRIAAQKAAPPIIIRYAWGQEKKSPASGKIIEADWTAGHGSYVKILNHDSVLGMDVDAAGDYLIPGGARFEWRIGLGRKACAIADASFVRVRRRSDQPLIGPNWKACP